MLVSVIVPVLNEAHHIARSVEAARAGGGPDEVEIIVVDGGSTDGTPDLVPAGVPVLRAPKGRARQMNAGAAASRGEVLVFCHGDSRLPKGWRDAVLAALSEPGVSGGTFQVAYEPARGLLRLINRWRSGADWRIMHGDQAQFMARETFDAVGGYPDIALMEDVEMARALHRRGRLVRVPLRVTSSSARFLRRGVIGQYARTTWNMIRYLYLGARPEDLARTYLFPEERAS